MKPKMILLFLSILCMSCGTIPPEFLTTMEKEREGINLLKERHQKTVYELTENWYQERLNRLLFIKQLEINKIVLSIPDTDGSSTIEVIKKESLEILVTSIPKIKFLVSIMCWLKRSGLGNTNIIRLILAQLC